MCQNMEMDWAVRFTGRPGLQRVIQSVSFCSGVYLSEYGALEESTYTSVHIRYSKVRTDLMEDVGQRTMIEEELGSPEIKEKWFKSVFV